MFEKIENKWTEDSGDYDDMIQKQLSNKRTVSYWTKELKRLLGPEPLRILEVGCGPGFMSIIAARLGHDVKAIDGSSGMVEKARRNMRQYHQQVEICEEDGVTLPLEQEQSYDVILSRDAVWTLYDPEKAFRRWKAVLKPGGRIIYFDGDYRTVEPTLKNKIHMKIADFLIYVTERKTYVKHFRLTYASFMFDKTILRYSPSTIAETKPSISKRSRSSIPSPTPT